MRVERAAAARGVPHARRRGASYGSEQGAEPDRAAPLPTCEAQHPARRARCPRLEDLRSARTRSALFGAGCMRVGAWRPGPPARGCGERAALARAVRKRSPGHVCSHSERRTHQRRRAPMAARTVQVPARTAPASAKPQRVAQASAAPALATARAAPRRWLGPSRQRTQASPSRPRAALHASDRRGERAPGASWRPRPRIVARFSTCGRIS